MVRRIVQTTLFSIAAVVFLQPAFCEHPDLSGTWHLDVAASAFSNMAIPDSGSLTISTGPHKVLHFQRVLKGSQTERTIESDWKTDDKFHPVVGDEPGTILARWDGTVLLGKRHTEAGMEEIRLVAAADGGTLTESIQSSQGLTTLVWRKR